MRMRVAVAVVVICPVLAACGGVSQESVDAAAEKAKAADGALGLSLSDELAACRSRILLESGLSDAAKAAVRRGEAPILASDRDVEAMQKAADRIARDCT